MTNFKSVEECKRLCLNILHAETEDEVIGIMQDADLWDHESLWQDYGGMDMNRSIVGNQQSSPVAALVEKIVNSLDAVLTAECLRSGIDPLGSEAPQTMQQAVEHFFKVYEGRIRNLTPGERTEISKRIQLIATGTKKSPNFIVIDEGEGQYPNDFPNTFLSLLRQNKTGIPFVQGKFNMGGTGVLQFAGRHSFQLILSRRRSDINLVADRDQGSRWGFTLVRRIDPGAGKPYSRYVYLAPQGIIPTFVAENIQARPGSYPKAYVELLEAGTAIKMWNYKVPAGLKTNLMFDMRRALEKHLPEPCLPIRLYERRAGYRAHSYETTLSGLSCVIGDNPEDVETGFDTGTPLTVSGVGTVNMRVTVVKEETIRGSNPKYPRGGVFFIVNGQLHSELDKGFIERRTKLDYIAGTTVVIVDCSKLVERIREDLFHGSRDRMRECEERDRLCSAIADYIKDHPGLRELNARRRQERLAAAISEEETVKIIQEIVRTDPSLADLFGKGKNIKVPRGPVPEREPYIGREFPTYFRLEKEPKEGLVKRCPRNRRARVKFETDATNDYFSRAKDPGRIEVDGFLNLASIHIWDGLAILTFELPERCTPGDVVNVCISVMDVSRVDPFSSSFKLHVEPEAEPSPSGPTPLPYGMAFTGLPNITEVRRHEWENWAFDEKSALALRSSGAEDGEELDIAINMDNLYLQNERARRRKIDPELLNYWFKYGLCLLALGILYETRKTEKEKYEAQLETGATGGRFDDVEKACRGLAVTIIPVISQLSKGKLSIEE